jgi:hypothetical protein
MLTPLFKSAFGPDSNMLIDLFDELGGVEEFAAVLNGLIPWYGDYTRAGTAYSESADGTITAEPTDVPPYEYIDGGKRARFYAGTNIIHDSQDHAAASWGTGSSAIVIPNTAISPDGTLTADTIDLSADAASRVFFAPVGTEDAGSYNYSVYLKSLPGDGSGTFPVRLTLPDSTNIDLLASINETEWSCLELSGTSATTGNLIAYVGNRNVTGETLTKAYAWQSQLSKTIYRLPTIPTNGTSVTVNPATTSLLAEDDGADKARTPWASSLGTKFGLKGFFEGVDGNPAVGVIPFTAYIPHSLTADMPLIKFTTSDFVALEVEQTTGLIKGYDGTNTCVSDTACVAGTETDFELEYDATQFWITKDGSQGTKVTFAGWPDVGLRVFFMTNGTYQTIESIILREE